MDDNNDHWLAYKILSSKARGYMYVKIKVLNWNKYAFNERSKCK